MKINDAIIGAVLAVLGVAILVHIQGYPRIPGQQYGPALFPGLIGAGLAVCGALLVRRGFRNGGRAIVLAEWTRSPRHATNFALIVAALVFYVAASEPLGFLACGTLILFALFWKLGVRPLSAMPIAVISTLAVYFMFDKMMRVPLPRGVLGPIGW